jgi:hypothetical protein
MTTGYMVPPPPFVAPDATVVEYDGDATLDIDDFGKNLTNTGATAEVDLTLPAPAVVAGLSTRVYLTTDNILELVPASGESIYLGGSGTEDEKLNIAAVVGNFAEIYSDGEKYHVLRYSGVLTKV